MHWKAIWPSKNVAIGDRVNIQRWLEIYWSVGKNRRRQGWEAVPCSSGSRDNRAGRRAGKSWHCPSCYCQEDEKREQWLLPTSGQYCPPPGMPQQYQEFPGWFLQGSDIKKRHDNLITSSDCLRQGCCQSQPPRLPVPTSQHPLPRYAVPRTEGSWAPKMQRPLRLSFPCLASPTFRSSLTTWFPQGLFTFSGFSP